MSKHRNNASYDFDKSVAYFYKVRNISNESIYLPVSKRTIFPGASDIVISEAAYNWFKDSVEVLEIIKKERTPQQ